MSLTFGDMISWPPGFFLLIFEETLLGLRFLPDCCLCLVGISVPNVLVLMFSLDLLSVHLH